MADEKSNFYDYEAFCAIPRQGSQTPTDLAPLSLRPLGRIEARDPDQALAFAAEKWPPPADQQREYSVCLASKWRSQVFKARATVAVEPVNTEAGSPAEPGPGTLEDAPGPLSRPGVA